MTEAKETSALIDFSKYVSERTRDFTGREWVFQAINDWLKDPNGSRFFLIVGKPGDGKTAISGRLYQFSQGIVKLRANDGLTYINQGFLSAVHFCYGDINWRNPTVFAKSLASQLGNRYPAYAKALIERNSDGRTNIGASLNNVTAQQAYAVHINELNIGGGAEDAFTRLIWEPLKAFFKAEHRAEITILVDALDEALLYDPTLNIVSLLSRSEDIPRGVRFVLTSRNDNRVLEPFSNAKINAKILELTSPEVKEVNSRDISNYIRTRIDCDGKLAVKVRRFKPEQLNKHTRTIINKADGNFQYVSFLLNAIAEGHQKFEEIKNLPIELDGLYQDYLKNFISEYSDEWIAYYAPVLGVLSVAQESLTQHQLRSFTGQSDLVLRSYLGRLQQFIEKIQPMGNLANEGAEYRYRLYHQSFVEFFGSRFITKDGKKFDNAYYLQQEEWHERIIDYYHAASESWKKVQWNGVDDYGLLHLTAHVYELRGNEAHRQELYELICKPFMRAKFKRFRSHQFFASDTQLAIEAAHSEEPPNLKQLVRCVLIYDMLLSLLTDVPLKALWALARIGKEEEAIGFVDLMGSYQKRQACQFIANALLERGDLAKAKDVFAIALEDDKLQSKREIDSYLFSIAVRVTRSADHLYRLLTESKAIRDEDPSDEIHFITRFIIISVLPVLARAGLFEEAMKIAVRIEDEYWRFQALNILIAFANVKQKPNSQEIADQVIGFVESVIDEQIKIQFLSKISLYLADVGENTSALKIIDWMLEVAQRYVTMEWGAGLVKGRAIEFNMTEVASTLALISRFDDALEVVKKYGKNAYSETYSQKMVGILEQMSDDLIQMRGRQSMIDKIPSWMLEKAKEIKVGALKADALGAAAVALVRTCQNVRAEKIARQALSEGINANKQILFAGIEDRLLKIFAVALAEVGEFQRAIKIVDKLEDYHTKAYALVTICLQMFRIDQLQMRVEALQIAERAFKIALEKIDYGQDKVTVLCDLAEAYFKMNKRDEAFKAADRALQVADKIKDKEDKVAAYCDIAEAYFKMNKRDEAFKAADRAFEITEANNNDFSRFGLIPKTAYTLALIGNKLGLDRLYKMAESGDDSPKDKNSPTLFFDYNDKLLYIPKLAAAFAEAGDYGSALDIVERVKSIKMIRDKKWKGWQDFDIDIMFGPIVYFIAKAGDYGRALDIVEENVKDKHLKVRALIHIARGLVNAGNKGKASQVVNQAMRLLEDRNIDQTWMEVAEEDDEQQPYDELAEILWKLGDYERSARVAKMEKYGSPSSRYLIIQALANVGRHKQALLLLNNWLYQDFSSSKGRSQITDIVGERKIMFDSFFVELETMTAFIAKVDQGQTLWEIYEAIMEVKSWWEA